MKDCLEEQKNNSKKEQEAEHDEEDVQTPQSNEVSCEDK